MKSAFYAKLAQKFAMCNHLPDEAGIRNYISKYLAKIVKCRFSAVCFYLVPPSRLATLNPLKGSNFNHNISFANLISSAFMVFLPACSASFIASFEIPSP